MPVAAFEQSVDHLQGVLSDSGAPSFGIFRARASNAWICMTNYRERQAVEERLEPRVGVRVEGEAGAVLVQARHLANARSGA